MRDPGPVRKITDDEPVLALQGITKRFGDVLACNNIDLSIWRGEIIALLGENGAGKTSLMNILFGHYVADQGSVLAAAPTGGLQPLPAGSPMAALEAGIGMVHQHFTLADNLNGIENIALGTENLFAPYQDNKAARFGLNALIRECGLHVDLDLPVGRLSVGERQRIEILKALYRGCHILVLDEPTAVLPPQEVEQLFQTLRHLAKQGVAIIFISHKLAEVRALADRIVILRNGKKIDECDPKITSDDTLAEIMVGRLVDSPPKEPLQPGAALLELKSVSTKSSRMPLDQVNLSINSHEIVGIAGIAGNGQGALSALISGQIAADQGEFRLMGARIDYADPKTMIRAGVGRIPEDRHTNGMVGEMTVWENLILESFESDRRWSKNGIIQKEAAQRYTADMIQRYRVRCPSVNAQTSNMSGGNIQKLILARIFEQAPRVILADQPTRGLDIGAVIYVHERLLEARARGAGILLISEDLDELLSLADRVHVIFGGRISAPLSQDMLQPAKIGLMMAGKSDAA